MLFRSVARTLGVKEETGRPLVETLAAALASRYLFLILDNCEHLLEACAVLAEALLSSGSTLRILATSREALALAGEHYYATPALALPPPISHEPAHEFREKDIAWLMEYGGMRLFVERAMQVQPAFRLTTQNAVAVKTVVQHLDGIPLAIELAAARVRSLSIMEIKARLHDCFALLGSGHRTALPRHQTLRALIDWSYDLLTEPERKLLHRLSVFAGGWSLEAALIVCAEQREAASEDTCHYSHDATAEILDLLTVLVDKSLVIYEEAQGEARYRLLETIRQYARERLAESGETIAYQQRHRDFFLALAEQANGNLKGPEQSQWLAQLELDHANLRQSLTSCLTDVEGSEAGLKLGVALVRFWQIRGYVHEGLEYLTALLARAEAQTPTRVRADALDGAGRLMFDLGNYASASSLHEESLTIYRELGDRKGMAEALLNLGHAAWKPGANASARSLYEESLAIYQELGDHRGIATSLNSLGNVAWSHSDYPSARLLYQESLVSYRKLGDRKGIADVLSNLGIITWDLGDAAAARSMQEESLQMRRELGDREGIASNLVNLGVVAFDLGDFVSARSLYTESLTLFRELDNRHGIALGLSNLGFVAFRQGDYATAYALQMESLPKWRELGNRHGTAYCLHNLGEIACVHGKYGSACPLFIEGLEGFQEAGDQKGIVLSLESFAGMYFEQNEAEKAALLWGAVKSIRQAMGSPLLSGDQVKRDCAVAKVRSALNQTEFATASATGQAMTIEQAMAYALENAVSHER